MEDSIDYERLLLDNSIAFEDVPTERQTEKFWLILLSKTKESDVWRNIPRSVLSSSRDVLHSAILLGGMRLEDLIDLNIEITEDAAICAISVDPSQIIHCHKYAEFRECVVRAQPHTIKLLLEMGYKEEVPLAVSLDPTVIKYVSG